MKKTMILFNHFLIISLLTLTAAQPAFAVRQLPVGNFSAMLPGGDMPAGWKPLVFKKIDRHTQYSLVHDSKSNRTVVKAFSQASASGLIRKMPIDPEKFPIIKWRWKTSNLYKNGDVTQKTGDDFPVRIYITFAYNADDVDFFDKATFGALNLLYGEYPPVAAITYIWENKLPVGAIAPNPFTDRVKMIVVESGGKNLNNWVDEERNIFDDYVKAFGKKPPMISGVAIITDSDNTGESAISYYGDIVFESKK
ncbi:MAG: DUF3047 domain-containing protein [Desulfobacteraceae bacterium]|nr:MAG: DUF3047 domain-containing protein [Desulfobacteraceae bacterium]